MDPRTVVLHVGEGKVGSSTIQLACLQSRDRLAAAGVLYPINAVWAKQHAALARELAGVEDTGSIGLLRETLAGHPGTVLLSSEYLAHLDGPALRRLRAELGDRPVQVVLYLRPYAEWLVSKYAQSTKQGRTMASWDVFFQRFERERVAARALRWAAVFGAEHVRVRTTDPTDLAGGTLLGDLSSVVGVPLAVTADANVSPSWMAVEAGRWTGLQLGHDHDPAERLRSQRRMIRLVHELTADRPRAQYLTPEQSDELATRWEEDLARLQEGLGHANPVRDTRVATPRPFLPAAAEIPEDVTAAVAEQLARPRVRERLPDADRTLLDRFAARDF